MPPVRAVTMSPNAATVFQLVEAGVTKSLAVSAIPAAQNTIALVESWINNVWVPANITQYQVRVHVFSLGPIRCLIGTFNFGLSIDPNWWQ